MIAKTCGLSLGAALMVSAALSVGMPGPAFAAPLHTAGTGCNGAFVSTTSIGFAEHACDVVTAGIFSPNPGSLHTTATSSAGPGFIRVRSQADVLAFGTRSGFNLITAQAAGEWFYDDFIVRGPGSSAIPAALNLLVSGFLGTATIDEQGGSLKSTGAANAQFFLQIELNGMRAGFGEIIRRETAGVNSQTVDGLFIGKFGSELSLTSLITSSELMLPVGSVFSVHVLANAGSNASGRVTGEPDDEFDFTDVGSLATSDFSSTVQFPTTGPVFVLPPGYTVESVSAGIANNRVLAPPQAVPEPSTLPCLVLALLYLMRAASRWQPPLVTRHT
jgi:hypothetical protein